MSRFKLVLLLALPGCVSAATEPAEHSTHAAAGSAHAAAAAPSEAIQPSTAAAAMMGLALAPVRFGVGNIPRRAAAFATFDPVAAVGVSVQSGGQVRSFTAPPPGDEVARGQVLAHVYDPSLHAILEELRVAHTLGEPWRSAAASRARALGAPEPSVRAVLDGGSAPETFTVRSPIQGVVASRSAAEGAWIAPGGVLVTLIDPTAVLVELVVDGSPPPVGTLVTLRTLGGVPETISAVVTGALPQASAAGAHVRVRPASPVSPGRPLVADWTDVTGPSFWVPASAVVDTGTRRVVFVQTEAGFVPRRVEPGLRAGEEIELLSGVSAGELIVTSGAFYLDSETQIGAMSHAGHGG